jgi:hypothetical protein
MGVDQRGERRHQCSMALIKSLLGEICEASGTVKRYEVESPSGERVFLIGFNVGKRDRYEYWTMPGRGGQYSSAEEALAVLEAEAACPIG